MKGVARLKIVLNLPIRARERESCHREFASSRECFDYKWLGDDMSMFLVPLLEPHFNHVNCELLLYPLIEVCFILANQPFASSLAITRC